jgi:flagellar basal body-associated protein FliL
VALVKILIVLVLLLVGVVGAVWWMVESDWYDKGTMDE